MGSLGYLSKQSLSNDVSEVVLSDPCVHWFSTLGHLTVHLELPKILFLPPTLRHFHLLGMG